MADQSLGAEAIREITALAKTAQAGPGLRFYQHNSLPSKLFILNSDNKVSEQDVERSTHNFVFHNLESFADWVDGEWTANQEGAIFIDTEKWIVSFHAGQPIDLEDSDNAYCRLIDSEQWSWFAQADGKLLDQKTMVRALRTTLKGSVPDSFVGIIRNIRFSTGRENVADLQHGQESLGKAITSSFRGTDTIPEEITVTIPRWQNFPECAITFVCVVDICCDTGRIALIRRAADMLYIPHRCEAEVRAKISDDRTMPPIYSGLASISDFSR